MVIPPADRWPPLSAEGAVGAIVDLPDGPRPDATSFFTALGLRALRLAGIVLPARQRMLDFLERCVVPDPPGAFAFWPIDARPAWAAGVPADADDTALCLLELHLAGRLTRAEAIRRMARLILPNRVRHDGTLRPPWVPEGAFATWLVPGRGGHNIVDCAVNANVLALMARLGLRDPAGRDAVARLIHDGLAWAGTDPVRLRALTPFYPEVAEFRLAVEHALACGARELAPAATRLAVLTGDAPPGPGSVICSGAYSRRGWRSPALAGLRSASQLMPAGRQS